MIKIIHSADWHIGQNFYGYDRKKEHMFFLEWLKNTIQENEVDVLLISGDIFDSPNPGADAQSIFYKFLKEVSEQNNQLQIIITAGNHDSAARMEAPNPVLQAMNIHIKGVVQRNTNDEIDMEKFLIPLYKNDKLVAWCMAVPYLRQGDYPASATYSQGVEAMFEALHQRLLQTKTADTPIIIMGHLHATGSDLSQDDRSERIVVGGLECVSPDIFNKQDVVYTALGHLHKGQRVGKNEAIRYSGSPLPMSFAEKNYKQGVNLIEIEGKELKQLTRIAFDAPVQLLSVPSVPKPLTEVLEELKKMPDGEVNAFSPFLEVKVLLTQPEPSLRFQIEEALKNKAIRFASAPLTRQQADVERKKISYEDLKTINPMEMAEDVFMKQYGTNIPDDMKSLLLNVIRDVTR